jgi:hypothetical protein
MVLAIPTGLIPVPTEETPTTPNHNIVPPSEAAQRPARTTKGEERRLAREALRERIARHLAGDAAPSNFEAMVRVLSADPSNGAEDCDDCGGLGHRRLARHVIEEHDQKLEQRLLQLELRQRELAAARAEAHRPRGNDELEEKLRQNALREVDDIEKKILVLRRNIEDDERALNKRSVCRTCRGTCRSHRRRGQGQQRPDSIFNTVTCPSCRGKDRRNQRRGPDGEALYPRLTDVHYGSSSGELRMRGNRTAPDGVTIVSDPRDDAAAERGDQCPSCKDERSGMGTGYLMPVTVRPSLRTSNVEEEPQGVQDLPDGFPSDDFDERSAGGAPVEEDWAASFLDELRAEDPRLAAAAAVYWGEHGDEWAKHTWGRRFALWPFLDDGRRLAEEAAGCPERPSYDELLALCAVERSADVQAPLNDGRPRRRARVRGADAQARLLEARIERALDRAAEARGVPTA